jgi:hypothetical protein
MHESAEDTPPTGLSSVVLSCCSGRGGGVMATVGNGGCGSVRTAPFGGGGGGSGHTADLVSGETQLASLAPIRGARVPVGQPLRPIQICDVACTPTLVGIWPMV